jgi:hypothetical protein
MSQSDESIIRKTGERGKDTSDKGILEILEQNAKWWEQAAVTCENTAARLPSGEKEEVLLMSAVYRERAGMHARLIEQLRGRGNGARG